MSAGPAPSRARGRPPQAPCRVRDGVGLVGGCGLGARTWEFWRIGGAGGTGHEQAGRERGKATARPGAGVGRLLIPRTTASRVVTADAEPLTPVRGASAPCGVCVDIGEIGRDPRLAPLLSHRRDVSISRSAATSAQGRRRETDPLAVRSARSGRSVAVGGARPAAPSRARQVDPALPGSAMPGGSRGPRPAQPAADSDGRSPVRTAIAAAPPSPRPAAARAAGSVADAGVHVHAGGGLGPRGLLLPGAAGGVSGGVLPRCPADRTMARVGCGGGRPVRPRRPGRGVRLRALLDGARRDGAPLVAPVLRADPRGRLPVVPLVAVVRARAASCGMDPDVLFMEPRHRALFGVLATRVDKQPGGRDAVLAAHRPAVGQMLAYLQWEDRHGLRGHEGDGQRAARVGTAGWIAARFEHHTSRTVHTLLVVPNLVHGADGKWSALDSRAVHRHATIASCLFRAVRRGQLTRRLGVCWTAPDKGIAEIRGLPVQRLTVTVPWAAGPRDHGCAMSCHRAPGVTVEVALLQGTGALTREAGYVARSRGRTANPLCIPERDDTPADGPHAGGRISTGGPP